jgi:uncharacterized surface protein with fasciclin (FAS1) repeats
MIQKKWSLLSLLFIASLICMGSCAAQNDTTARYGVLEAANDLGLSEFSALTESSSLSNTLNNQGVLTFSTGSFVIFAPSDEAFAGVTGVDMNSVKENRTDLKRILSYHVVWNDGAFENVSELSSVRTLQGENLTLNNTDGLKVNGANVTLSQKYDNGTIYVIDQVLLPEKSSVLGVAEAANDLGAKKFATAIKAAGLEETLNGQGLMGIESLSEGPFTIFAPSDAAFDKAKSEIDSINKKDQGMIDLLGYHTVDAKELINMTDTNSVKTLQGESLAVDVGAGQVGGALVLKSERYDNGIVYVIDRVLVPIGLSM